MHKVSFVGSGNLAWHLAPALDNVGYPVREVYSKNPKHAAALVGRLYEAHVNISLDFSASASRIFIISVSDDAIQEVAQKIVLPDDAIVVHTSGSQPLSVLDDTGSQNMGVFYPLQTFSKAKKVDFKSTPIFVESESSDVEKVLMKMAKALSGKVKRISSEERKALHVAAVFASNFSNHMLTIAKEITKQNDLDFDVLKPLIAETLNKSLEIGPEKSQTGPAVRGDFEILERHMEFLKENPELAEIYKVVSQHIIDSSDQ
jgi:predicted short-subunit dehydrogenase-like oxidoreductase (DUF2520 family)